MCWTHSSHRSDLVTIATQPAYSTLIVLVVRKDLLGSPRRECPIFLDYTVQAKANSVYNTPNVWGVYIFNLMLKWVQEKGGIKGQLWGQVERNRNRNFVREDTKISGK